MHIIIKKIISAQFLEEIQYTCISFKANPPNFVPAACQSFWLYGSCIMLLF